MPQMLVARRPVRLSRHRDLYQEPVRSRLLDDQGGLSSVRLAGAEAMTLRSSAIDYMARGWSPIPVPWRSKDPGIKDWPKLRVTGENVGQYFNGARQNIGILLGEPSGGLTDIDLDCPEAVAAARHLLPNTGCVFGRAGNPRSHHLFIAPSIKTRKLTGPDGEVLLELRATGIQTIFPPSTHPSGEAIEWLSDNGPAQIEGARLTRIVGLVAAAALIARSWPAHGRHDATLALAGALRRAAWTLDQATLFVRAVAEAAHDEEARDRERAVADTYARDGTATGWPRLAEMLGHPIVSRLRAWLRASPEAPVGEEPSWGNGKNSGAGNVGPPPPEFISAPNLWRMRHEPTRWAVRQILPEGVTIFGGKPKTGKSWLALDVALAVGTGGCALGVIKVEAGPVLYLALEDTKRRLTKRLRILCGNTTPPAEQIEFLTDCLRLGSGGEEVLHAWLRDHPTARLVVIDTLPRFRPHANAKETPYANDYVVGEYLSRLCVEFQVSILVLGHLRKQPGDDPIDEISGTLGLVGSVDGYMVLRRQAMSDDATLYVCGRDVDDPSEYCIRWHRDQARWTITDGDPLVSRLPAEQRRVYELLSKAPKNAKELTEALNPGHLVTDPTTDTRRRAAAAIAHKLLEKGLIARRTFDGRWTPANTHTTTTSTTSSASDTSTTTTHKEEVVPGIPGKPGNSDLGRACTSCAGAGCGQCAGYGRLIDDEPEETRGHD